MHIGRMDIYSEMNVIICMQNRRRRMGGGEGQTICDFLRKDPSSPVDPFKFVPVLFTLQSLMVRIDRQT